MENNKNKVRVIARIVKSGQCRYYKDGQSFVIGGFTPAGMCSSAYLAVIRDAQAMRYGAVLPWQNDGKIRTHCPDPDGAVWELSLEQSGETSGN